MKAFMMISVCVGLALARPQYYPTTYNGLGYNGLGYNAVPYAVASPQYIAAPAPVVTYEQNIIPDTAPAPVIPYTPIAVQPAHVPTEYKSQYHSQDELGQFSFGHISADQAHHQTRDYTGAVQGSYTYINAEGEQVVAHYIADHNGFRVSSNDLPVAPTFDGVAPIDNGVAPINDLVAPVFDLEPVMDTDEVKAAIAEHFRLVEEHKKLVAEAEAKTEAPVERTVEPEVTTAAPVEETTEEEIIEAVEATTDAPVEEVAEEVVTEEIPAERRKRQVLYTAGAFPATIPVAAAHQVVHHPEFYSGFEVAPVDLTPAEGAVVAPAPIAPVVTEGELLRIENNPGHAVSYRVY